MLRPSKTLLASLALALVSPALAVATVRAPLPQADAPPAELPDKRPEVAELCDRLDEHVDARGEEDGQATSVLERLTREFAQSGPKDRAAIVKAVAKTLDARRKMLDEETFDNALHLAAAAALGAMGPESVKPLERAIGNKKLRDDLDLQATLILALGRTRAKDAIDTLVDLLLHPEFKVQAAAGSALGEYAGFDQKVRKEIFKEVLKVHNSVIDTYNTGLSSEKLNERLRTVAPPMNETLEKMSGVKREGHDKEFWNRWWNDHKRDDWDADREDPPAGGR